MHPGAGQVQMLYSSGNKSFYKVCMNDVSILKAQI
jgi:hypothetical protein